MTSKGGRIENGCSLRDASSVEDLMQLPTAVMDSFDLMVEKNEEEFMIGKGGLLSLSPDISVRSGISLSQQNRDSKGSGNTAWMSSQKEGDSNRYSSKLASTASGDISLKQASSGGKMMMTSLETAKKTEEYIGAKANTMLEGTSLDRRDAIEMEEEDVIGDLPRFGLGKNKENKKRDPRRQSTAIFSYFENSMSSMGGLLDDEEIALGDEDILIPLKNADKMGSLGTNALWVDPNTDDFLQEEELPELCLEDIQPKEKAESGETRHGCSVADSISLLSGFSLACATGESLDDACKDESDVIAFLSEAQDLVEDEERTNKEEEKAEATLPKLHSNHSTKEQNAQTEGKTVKTKPPSLRPSRLKPPSAANHFFTSSMNVRENSNRTKSSIEKEPGKITRMETLKQKQKEPLGESKIQKSSMLSRRANSATESEKCGNEVKDAYLLRKERDHKNQNHITENSSKNLMPKRHAGSSRSMAPVKPSKLPVPSASKLSSTKDNAGLGSTSLSSSIQKREPISIVPSPSKLAKPSQKIDFTPNRTPRTSSKASFAGSKPEFDLTPQSAQLRWLERHPELAFGGKQKIANSPAEKMPEQKRKTALDAHYEAWGRQLSPLR